MGNKTAQSDFFLLSALLIFGSQLKGLLLNSIFAFITVPDYAKVVIEVVLYAFLYVWVPIWLLKYRDENPAEFFVIQPKDFVFGLLLGSPHLLIFYNIYQTLPTRDDLAIRLFMTAAHALITCFLVFILAVIIKKAAESWDSPFARKFTRPLYIKFQTLFIGAAIAASMLVAILHDYPIVFVPVLLIPIALVAERFLRITDGVGYFTYVAPLIMLFLVEVNIFGIIFDPIGFAVQVSRYVQIAIFGMFIVAAMAHRRNFGMVYGYALFFGLAGHFLNVTSFL